MSDHFIEHGAKIALGIGAIVVSYLLYSCVMSAEEPAKVEEPKKDEEPK